MREMKKRMIYLTVSLVIIIVCLPSFPISDAMQSLTLQEIAPISDIETWVFSSCDITVCDITVPEDFPTIQEAINNAQSGWIICVDASQQSVFQENILVNVENLTIEGINGRPIIDGSKNGNAVTIISNDVIFKNFEIINADEDGVGIIGSSRCLLEDLVIRDTNHNGVTIYNGANNNTVRNCEFFNIGKEHKVGGITFYPDGIWIFNNSNDNNIIKNHLEDICGTAIDIGGGRGDRDSSTGWCNGNKILENQIKSVGWNGIFLNHNSSYNTISFNIIDTVGVPEYYTDGNGIDIGLYCSDNEICGNTVTNISNQAALVLNKGACNNRIIDNQITNNHEDGIKLRPGVCGCYFINNLISRNSQIGICVESDACDNTFYFNEFLHNTINARDENPICCNRWYSREEITYKGITDYVGNKWSDYDGTDDDGDGRGEKPYHISGGNCIDEYPIGLFEIASIIWIFPKPDDPYLIILGNARKPYKYNWIIGPTEIIFTFKINEEGWGLKDVGGNPLVTLSDEEGDTDHLDAYKNEQGNWEVKWESTTSVKGVVTIRVDATFEKEGVEKRLFWEQKVWRNIYPNPDWETAGP